MMTIFVRRAIQDIARNKFLNFLAVIIISLSIMITSAFVLFFINSHSVMNSWKQSVKIMAYLKPDISKENIANIKQKILKIQGTLEVKFISKTDAINILKNRMKRQQSLFENLEENPLPDAFEILIKQSSQHIKKIEIIANQIKSLSMVNEVEYGRKWLKRFSDIFDLFMLIGYSIAVLFFMGAVFIVANTIRLIIYSRREEIEIMSLVGASNTFIKAPFYIEGIMQGVAGGVIGLAALSAACMFVSSVGQDFSYNFFHIKFFSNVALCEIVICSVFMGWLGCHISLKQFLKL